MIKETKVIVVEGESPNIEYGTYTNGHIFIKQGSDLIILSPIEFEQIKTTYNEQK